MITFRILKPNGHEQASAPYTRPVAEQVARALSRDVPGTWRVVPTGGGVAVAKFKNGRRVRK